MKMLLLSLILLCTINSFAKDKDFKSCYCNIDDFDGNLYSYTLTGLYLNPEKEWKIMDLARGKARYNIMRESGDTGISRANRMCELARTVLISDNVCPKKNKI